MSSVHIRDFDSEDLSKYFHLPINVAAREIGVCATVLKKICRKNGIPRWPHRKIKSIDKMIETLKHSLQRGSTEEDDNRIRKEIKTLEEHKHYVINNPGVLVKKVKENKRKRETQSIAPNHSKKQRISLEPALEVSSPEIEERSSTSESQEETDPRRSYDWWMDSHVVAASDETRPVPLEPRIVLYPVPLGNCKDKQSRGTGDLPLPDWFRAAKDHALDLQRRNHLM
eukprot:TRINITY_DN8043_c0_g1_i1.p1 TRINITY_DN8043_c0_g1~~TRINITY_DN8043_c0_g1_i1.p1  ORF type:complete len:227 (-),score=37.46 TRINITY_DN8043_c0_g1_i1:29-709(-)